MSSTRLPFEDVFADESGGNIKTPQSEYKSQGRFPVVDQGKSLIAGYVDEEERLCGEGRSAIVFGDHTRCVKYIDHPFCMGADGVKVLRPKIPADLKYLYYYLKQVRLPDAGYDRHFKYLKRTEIVLPPLEEQRRIATILDKADALRTKRREALAHLDRLVRSIYLEMFGDPATNPRRIRSFPLGELIRVKSGDFLPSSEMASDGAYPVFGGNGVNGYHDNYLFDESRIVIGRVGVYCGCVHITPPKSWVTDNALYVSHIDARVNFCYLAYSLQLANLNQYASQSAQPLVSGGRIYPVSILVPPLEQQLMFVERKFQLDKLRESLTQSLSETEALFTSLQHRFFRGEL
ncbi:restriction endonuclease subunit S [Burkholderia cepacia]|uniref:restriction endonuclease subunit S n=1 Tax=Burkholderia cepacia TaxID=292 RepID=UPI0009C0E7D2|nr:restriction endonuclease subunit S [Burkholderia cepacia]